MRQLLCSTTAYSVFSRDVAEGRPSHACMVYFQDAANLRFALKLFALRLFDVDEQTRAGSLILSEGFSDVKIYPEEGKKPSVADADDMVSESALRPIESDKKLLVFCNFDQASPVVQNKLLKLLEEPPRGVYLLLGATSLSPVLQTVLSRVKLLEIPPFSCGQVLEALNRNYPGNSLNELAAQSSAGIYGQAQAMVSGTWFSQIIEAAKDVCSADTLEKAGEVSLKHADIKNREELLRQVQRIYFEELKKCRYQGHICGSTFTRPALVYAVESVNRALEEAKFNAAFSALLFRLTSGIITENDKWKKLLV